MRELADRNIALFEECVDRLIEAVRQGDPARTAQFRDAIIGSYKTYSDAMLAAKEEIRNAREQVTSARPLHP